MKSPSLFKPLAAVALMVAWLHGEASASTIFWYSGYDSKLVTSQQGSSPGDPATPLDSSYLFELGTFGMAFTPTAQNVDQWVANWKVLDRVGLLDDPDNGALFFDGTLLFDETGRSLSPEANPADLFVQGEKVYVWAFNSKDIVPESEWALVTDSGAPGYAGNPWIVPDPLDPPGTSYYFDLQFADQAVVGGVNNVRGPGDYGANVPALFNLQTTPVPEPGSALLLFGAAAAFLTRRATRRLNRSVTVL